MAGLNPYLVPDDTPVSANPYTGLVNTQYAATPEERISSRNGGGLARGWNLGMYENPATELEGQALDRYSAGDVAGGDAARANADAMRRRGVAFERQNPTVGSVNDIGSAMNYVGESIGQGLSSSVKPALYAAPAALLGSNPVGWAVGLGLGAAGAYGMEKGEQAQNLMDDPTIQAKLKSGELNYQDLLTNAREKATINSVLESAVPGALGSKALARVGEEVLGQGFKGAAKHVGKEVLKNTLEEGATEGAQTISGEVLKNQLTGGENIDWANVGESALQGALSGGAMGGVSGTLEAAKRNIPGLTAGTSFEDTRKALGELAGRKDAGGEDPYAASVLGKSGMPADVAAEAIKDPKVGVEWLRKNKQDTQDNIGAMLDAALTNPDLDPAKRQQYEALRGTAFSPEFGKELATERATERATQFADQASEALGEVSKDYAETAQSRPEYADIDADEAASRTLAAFVPHGDLLPADKARKLWESIKPLVLSGFKKKGKGFYVPAELRDIFGGKTNELIDKLEAVYSEYDAENRSTSAIRQAEHEAGQNKLGVLGNLVNQHLQDDVRRNLGPEEKRQLGSDLDRLLDHGIDAKNKAAVHNHLAPYFGKRTTEVLDAIETFRRKDRIQGQQGRTMTDAEAQAQRAGEFTKDTRADHERGGPEDSGSDAVDYKEAEYDLNVGGTTGGRKVWLNNKDGERAAFKADDAIDGRALTALVQKVQRDKPDQDVRVRRLSDLPAKEQFQLFSEEDMNRIRSSVNPELSRDTLAKNRYVVDASPRNAGEARHDFGHFTQADLFNVAHDLKQTSDDSWQVGPERSHFFVKLKDDTVIPNDHSDQKVEGNRERRGMLVLENPEGAPPGRYLRVSGQKLEQLAAQRGTERGRLDAEPTRGGENARRNWASGMAALLSSPDLDVGHFVVDPETGEIQGRKRGIYYGTGDSKGAVKLSPASFGKEYNVIAGKTPVNAGHVITTKGKRSAPEMTPEERMKAALKEQKARDRGRMTGEKDRVEQTNTDDVEMTGRLVTDDFGNKVEVAPAPKRRRGEAQARETETKLDGSEVQLVDRDNQGNLFGGKAQAERFARPQDTVRQLANGQWVVEKPLGHKTEQSIKALTETEEFAASQAGDEDFNFEPTGEEKSSTLPRKELELTNDRGETKADVRAKGLGPSTMPAAFSRAIQLAANGGPAQLGVLNRMLTNLSLEQKGELRAAAEERLATANRAERPGLEQLRDQLSAELPSEKAVQTSDSTEVKNTPEQQRAFDWFDKFREGLTAAPQAVHDALIEGSEAVAAGDMEKAREIGAKLNAWAKKQAQKSNAVSTEEGVQDGQEKADAQAEVLSDVPTSEQVEQEARPETGAQSPQDEARSVEREARSSEHGERGTSSEAQRAEAEAFIKKVTKDVEVKWHESIPKHPLANGLHQLLKNGKEVIHLALSALNPLTTAHHESMHSLFTRMSASDNPAVQRAAERLTAHVMSPVVTRELKALYAGRKMSLVQMNLDDKAVTHEPGSKAYNDMVHERLAYWFQAWMLGDVRANGTHRPILKQIVDLLRRAVGMLSDQQRVDDIMREFSTGKMSTPGEIASVLEDTERKQEALKRYAKAVQPTTDWLKDTLMPSAFTLRAFKDPAIDHIVRLMHNNVGDKVEGLGFLPATDRARNSWTGRWYHGMEKFTEQEIKRATEVLSQVAVDAKAPEPTDNENVDAIVQHNLAMMKALHEYQRAADVRILRDVKQEDGSVKKQWIPLPEVEHYWPRVWDFDAIAGKQDAFVQLLLQDKYGEALDKLRGDKMTREQVARAIADRLVNGDREGTAEDGLDLSDVEGGAKGNLGENEGRVGYTPWAQHANSRMLDFIDYADFKDFVQHDLHAAATTYISQATKRAEYARRFRYDGKVIQDAVKQATKNEDARQLERFKGDKARAEATASKRISHVVRNIMAMEGTLGAGINPRLRKAMGIAQVYQNIRLLPLGLMAQVIDPAALMVRGATMGEAWNAYKRGVSEVLAGWGGKQVRDDAAKLAERLGTVETDVHSALLGEAFGGNWLQGTARKLNDKLFAVNGMRAWNRGIRIAATQSALRAIPEYLNDKVHGERHMAELGLQAGDIKMVNGRLALTEQDGLTAEQARRVTQGVYRWVNEANLRPNAAHRPALSSDPHFAAFYQYKSFIYTFTETILKRMAVELKHDNANPLLQYAALAVPAIVAADTFKAALLNGGDLPGYMQTWGPMDFVGHGISRAGLLGVGEMAIDAGEGNIGSLLGPSLNQILQSFDHSAARDLFDAIPGINQLRGLRPGV